MKLIKRIHIEAVSHLKNLIALDEVDNILCHKIYALLVQKPIYLGARKYPDSLTMLEHPLSFYRRGLREEEGAIFKGRGGY